MFTSVGYRASSVLACFYLRHTLRSNLCFLLLLAIYFAIYLCFSSISCPLAGAWRRVFSIAQFLILLQVYHIVTCRSCCYPSSLRSSGSLPSHVVPSHRHSSHAISSPSRLRGCACIRRPGFGRKDGTLSCLSSNCEFLRIIRPYTASIRCLHYSHRIWSSQSLESTHRQHPCQDVSQPNTRD